MTIHNKERSLRAGSQHEFTCEALGSRPAAVISWWFDDQNVDADVDNVQIVSNLAIKGKPLGLSPIGHSAAVLDSKSYGAAGFAGRGKCLINYRLKRKRPA